MTRDLPTTVSQERDCSKVSSHECLQGATVLTLRHREVGIEVSRKGIGLRDLVDDDKWRTSGDGSKDSPDLETNEDTRYYDC